MDDLDQLLAGLKTPEPPHLAEKNRLAFRRRRRRFLTLHAAASLTLISAGLWLLLPASGLLEPSRTGLELLQNLVRAASSSVRMDAALIGMADIQTSLSASLGTWNWLGLVALGVGVMLGMNAVLPGRNSYF